MAFPPVIFANLPDGLSPLSLFDQMFALAFQGARTQRSITSSANLPLLATDSILNVNIATTMNITVPLASSRNGAPFTFKVLPGSHVPTLLPTGGDTFDGLTTFPLVAGQSITLVPYNDGVNTGYGIE